MEQGKELMEEGPVTQRQRRPRRCRRSTSKAVRLGQQFSAITRRPRSRAAPPPLLSSNLQSIALANSEQREVVSNLAITARELEALAADLRQEVNRFRVGR